MASFRKELAADVQLLLGADAHECFDIPLLQRTEHVVDFLHGSLLGRGAAVTGVCNLVRCTAKSVAVCALECVLINAQKSGFGGEAEILCSTRALPVLTPSRHKRPISM